MGVNCTAPQWVEPLLLSVQPVAKKPLLVYPNRGEEWDPLAMCWIEWQWGRGVWRTGLALVCGGRTSDRWLLSHDTGGYCGDRVRGLER